MNSQKKTFKEHRIASENNRLIYSDMFLMCGSSAKFISS
jgi:hypothetical protein